MQLDTNPFLVLPVGSATVATNKFKRYANRKIYSLDKSHYVNVGDVADVVRAGQTPVVTDHKGNDITAMVLAQAILQEVEATLDQPDTLGKVTSFLRQF